jgi:hypothetical protein
LKISFGIICSCEYLSHPISPISRLSLSGEELSVTIETAEEAHIIIDDFSITSRKITSSNLVPNGDFSDGLNGWYTYGPVILQDGNIALLGDPGAERKLYAKLFSSSFDLPTVSLTYARVTVSI